MIQFPCRCRYLYSQNARCAGDWQVYVVVDSRPRRAGTPATLACVTICKPIDMSGSRILMRNVSFVFRKSYSHTSTFINHGWSIIGFLPASTASWLVEIPFSFLKPWCVFVIGGIGRFKCVFTRFFFISQRNSITIKQIYD